MAIAKKRKIKSAFLWFLQKFQRFHDRKLCGFLLTQHLNSLIIQKSDARVDCRRIVTGSDFYDHCLGFV